MASHVSISSQDILTDGMAQRQFSQLNQLTKIEKIENNVLISQQIDSLQ